jgi:DNA-binding beta-propeller fold protein YncE
MRIAEVTVAVFILAICGTATAANLYVTQSLDGTVSKITPDGVVSTFATISQGASLTGVAFDDSSDNLYVAYGNSISKVTPDGVVSTFATVGFGLMGLAFDRSGNLYADSNWGDIAKITPTGVVSTFATPMGFYPNTQGLACDSSGNLYMASTLYLGSDGSENISTIYKFTPDGVMRTFATSGVISTYGTSTGLNGPEALPLTAMATSMPPTTSAARSARSHRVVS